MLWRFLPALFKKSELAHSDYRNALQKLANHPNAGQMSVGVRVMLAFERVLAFLTAPFHAILGFFLGRVISQKLIGAMLLPITIGRFFVHERLRVAAESQS
jgi:hypothetical protein